MAPRALGALLAILAAIAFVVSIASSAWWAGNPIVEGRAISAKEVRVGLMGATGCNTGGDGKCEPVKIGSTVELAGNLVLVAIALVTILAFSLAVSAWRVGDRRKGLANVTMVVAVLAAAGGGALLLLGPDIEASQRVEVPIGWGTFVFGGAIVSTLLAAQITRRLEPEPLRLKPSMAQIPPPPDVREILREHGGLAPSALGPEPMLGSGPNAALSPTGPGGRESAPLIGGAPQLRPLYDPQNDGFVPAPPAPVLPVRAPTPIPRSMVSALTGQATPPPERAKQPSSPPPVAARSHAPSNPPPTRTGSPSSPPPLRTTSPSNPPPARTSSPSSPPPTRTSSPSSAPPARSGSPSSPPPARTTSPSVAPPARTSSPSAPPPIGREKPPSVAPPTTRPKLPSTPPPPRSNAREAVDPFARTAMQPASAAAKAVGARAKAAAAPTHPDTEPVPVVRAPRARTTPGPGTDPAVKPLPRSPQTDPLAKALPNTPGDRPSAPTLAHAVPPMPTEDNLPPPVVLPATRASTDADDRLATALRETEHITAVEIDADAKAAAQAAQAAQTAKAPGTTPGAGAYKAPRGPAPQRLASEARTGQREAMVGDVTETGLDVKAVPESRGRTSVGAGAGPLSDTMDVAPRADSIGESSTQDAPRYSDSIAAQRGLSVTLDAQRYSDSVPAQRAATADEGPVTDVLAAQNPGLADELAASMHEGTEVTDQSRFDDLPPSRNLGHTPIPTKDRPVTQVPISTAPTSLPPPRTVETVTSGPTPACPQCESPMAWVEEHLRFYCKQCRMYF